MSLVVQIRDARTRTSSKRILNRIQYHGEERCVEYRERTRAGAVLLQFPNSSGRKPVHHPFLVDLKYERAVRSACKVGETGQGTI